VRYFLGEVLFPEHTPSGHTTSGVSEAQKQPSAVRAPKQQSQALGSTPCSPLSDDSAATAPTDWDQQVADVAAMDTADLLKQLRGE